MYMFDYVAPAYHSFRWLNMQVILDTGSYDTWSERGKHLLHGDGKAIWFDKSFSLLFFSDGKMGLNAEHAWADAPVMAHISEHHLSYE